MNVLDRKIKEVLDQVDQLTPQPPGFDDLQPGPSHHARRLVPIAAAAALLVAGVAGIMIVNANDSGTIDRLPAIEPTDPTQVPTTVGETVTSTVTTAAPSVETATTSTPSTTVAPTDGQLLRTPIDADAIPYITIADASITRAYSDVSLAIDTGYERIAAIVGEGPTYDAPLLAAFVASESPAAGDFETEGIRRSPNEILESMYSRIGETEADGEDVNVVEVDVAGRRGVAEIRASDPDTKLDGPIVALFASLDDDTILVVNSTRLAIDETTAIASTIVASPDGAALPTPAGYTELAPAPANQQSTFVEYQYELDGRQIQITASNRGTEGLLGRILTEVRTNRVVADTDVAYRPLLDSPGRYWADWIVGDWSFYVDAFGFASEEEFLDVLPQIEQTDVATIEAQLADGVTIVEGITAFCGTYATLQGEQPESYVGSVEHVADINQLLGVAPESLTADLTIFHDYLSSGAINPADDPQSTTAENWPTEVQTAIANTQAFAGDSC